MSYFKSSFKLLYAILLVMAISFSSCSEDTENVLDASNSDPTDNGTVKVQELSCTIDGTSFKAGLGFVSMGGFLTLTGDSYSNGKITIMLLSKTVGEKSLTFYTNKGVYDINGEVYYSVSGTCNLTHFEDNKVKGTFSFEAETVDGAKTVSVTNGSFEYLKE
ncbi:MAG: DUF6252 family protein [Candidatus Kapabacteria bacterium]|jgi:hypothetical protein|nr:DUF6252 family protein [Candidatus Kapabacteria bacterium]